jgi:hypothetical protein
MSYSTRQNIRTGPWALVLFTGLIATGLAGNHFPFSILNAHFIFGSIFAMLALQIFGWGRGAIAAAVISAYTYFSSPNRPSTASPMPWRPG